MSFKIFFGYVLLTLSALFFLGFAFGAFILGALAAEGLVLRAPTTSYDVYLDGCERTCFREMIK